MDNFKEPKETEIRQVNETDVQINETNPQTKHVALNVNAAPPMDLQEGLPQEPRWSDLPSVQRKKILADQRNAELKSSLAGLLGLVVIVAIIGVVALTFMKASKEQSIPANEILNMSDLKSVAGKDVLVKIKGLALASDEASLGDDKVAFQAVQISDVSRRGHRAQAHYPPAFSIGDEQGQISIDASELSDFYPAKERGDKNQILKPLRTADVEDMLNLSGPDINLSTIKVGDEVTAEGRVVWDDQRKKFVLRAPSLFAAPLAAGLIRLQTTGGPRTF